MSTLRGGGALRFGLVGCGVIAETYAHAFAGLGSARLVAVSDSEPERSARFAQAHGVEDAGPVGALLARDDIDAVVVCTPSGLHAQVGLAAVAAGKHVVVEKPIDVNLAAARSLVDGAAQAGVSLHVISQQRYNPGVQRAKALLDQGALGRVVFVQASVPWSRSDEYYASASWRATWELDGGGAFMNQGVHYADLVCWLFGPPRVEAARCAALAHDIAVEDVALALLSFEGGALGMLEASTVAYPGFPAVLRAHGTNGTLVLEDGALVRVDLGPAVAGGEAGAVHLSPQAGLSGAGALAFPDAHRAQLADITEAISQGRASLVGGEDGCRALQFVLDVYGAARWGPHA